MPNSTQFEVLASCSVREPLSRFALWIVQELPLRHQIRDGCCYVRIPENRKHELAGQAVIAFYLSDSDSGSAGNGAVASAGAIQIDDGQEPFPSPDDQVVPLQLTADEPFFCWLCEELHARGPAAHTRPRQDPQSVYEISERLFREYRVDGGRVHLSGCTLEEQPFLRLTYVSRESATDVKQLFFTPDGTPADTLTRDALGLPEVCRKRSQQSAAGESQVALLVAAGKRFVQSFAGTTDSVDVGVAGNPVAISLIWAKWAVGRLRFTIGEQSVDVPFEGWARTLRAPPFVCPHSGLPSFHVAATDDGQIAAAEAIETCARSGRRVLASELVTCSVTNLRVLPQFTRICPVSGKPALIEEFDPCEQCRQEVSRVVLRDGICDGCRNLAPVPGDDPRLVWLLGEYPRLEGWKRWRFSETAALYIAVGTRLFGHLLLVMDKETLEPRYAAARGRFRRTWYELDPTDQQEFFAERAITRPE